MGPARKKPDLSTYSGRFADRLRQLRDKAKLTPEDVANHLEMHVMTVYKWESGKTSPNLKMFEPLAKLYQCKSPRDLLPEK